jgi:hypothetical protein
MKLCLQANHFNTTPDRVQPPGAKIEEGNLLATDFSLVTDFDSIDFLLDPQTAAREPVFARGSLDSIDLLVNPLSFYVKR